MDEEGEASGIHREKPRKTYRRVSPGREDLYAPDSSILVACSHARRRLPVLWACVRARLLSCRLAYEQHRHQANLPRPVRPAGAAVHTDLSQRHRLDGGTVGKSTDFQGHAEHSL